MSGQLKITQLNEDLLLNCMRCGYCLQSCPTYRQRQIETHSPRGRVALMRAVQEGKLELMDIAGALDYCVGCQVCETVCPAGVEYGNLLFEAKAELEKIRPHPWIVRFMYTHVLGTPGGIKLAGFGLWFYQRSGLRWLARTLNMVKLIGGQGLADMEMSMPEAVSPSVRKERKAVTPAEGPKKLKVAFFTGCISDVAFFETNQNAVEVLAAAGCEVHIPTGQGCCGAVHSHTGDMEQARVQARRNIAAFESGGYDYIVNVAGGCGAELRHYDKLLKDEPGWYERAVKFSRACRDFSELLATLEPLPMGELDETITYQDSCHLRNVQKVSAQPRKLLKAIPKAKYVELPEADQCCGSGGTYSVAQPGSSDKMLTRKMMHVQGTGATTVVVTNPGCHLEMIEGVQRAGLEQKIKVRHIADVLADALRRGRKK